MRVLCTDMLGMGIRCLLLLGLVLLRTATDALLLPGCSTSHSIPTLRCGPQRVPMTCMMSTQQNVISPRKKLFFEIVESGLNDRFPVDRIAENGEKDPIARVRKFCSYARRDIPPPQPQGVMHDPCEEFIDGLSATAWWDTSRFQWVTELEARAQEINKELQTVLAKQEVFIGDSRYQQTMGAGWTALRLQRMGEWNEENTALFPFTTSLLRKLNIPLAVRGVMFAKQQPGTGVQPHSDGRNFILTAHLGLQVPSQGCWISVANERRQWQQDKVIVFDTSFTHETGNESDEDRFVLIIDFWHPQLAQEEREALSFIYDCRNKFDGGMVEQIDCSYIREKKPTDVDAYIRSKRSAGNFFASLFKF